MVYAHMIYEAELLVQQLSFLAATECATALAFGWAQLGYAWRKGKQRFTRAPELFHLLARCLRASTSFPSVRRRAHLTYNGFHTPAPSLPSAPPPPHTQAHPHQTNQAPVAHSWQLARQHTTRSMNTHIPTHPTNQPLHLPRSPPHHLCPIFPLRVCVRACSGVEVTVV